MALAHARRRASRVLTIAALLGSLAWPAGLVQAVHGGIHLTTPFPAVAVGAGDQPSFTLTVTSPVDQRVAVAVTEVPEGWTTTLRGGGFVVDAVSAGPSTSPELSLEVSVPADAAADTYRVTVQASAGSERVTLPIGVRVAEEVAGSVTLEAEFPSLRGAADTMFTFDLNLTNDTAEETTFSLEAAGGAEGWQLTARPSGQAQASTATVAPGESAGVTLEVDPPDDTPAGTYPVGIRAVGGGNEAVAELQVEITGDFAISLTTPDERLNATVVAGGSTQLQMVVLNEGTAPLVGVTLTATPPAQWDVTFEPASVEQIAPGESATVTATIVPSGDAVAGDYAVNMRAEVPEANDSVEIRTTVETSLLWGAIGIALIIATFAGLAWLFRRYGRR
jgi:uncharacterized membrane protein